MSDLAETLQRKKRKKRAIIALIIVVAIAAVAVPIVKKVVADSHKVTVTVEIRCDTLAADTSKLTKPQLKSYVPKNGTILAKTEYTGTDQETVMNALLTVCKEKGIHMETTKGADNSEFVDGINHLYSRDAGKLSGWMFKVNDKFPDYGAGSVKLKDGDEIIWLYTCNMGEDL